VLVHEPGRSGGDGVRDPFGVGGGGEDEDAGSLAGLEAFEDALAVEAGHLEVEEDDVGAGLGDGAQRLIAVPGLADDGEVGFEFEIAAEAAADHGVVVDEEEADLSHVRPLRVRWCRG
ncbi:hypothetical protein ADL26_16605, partial [Thermoactinomyces vulgaris]